MNNILIVDDTYEKTQVIASIVKDLENCNLEYCSSSRDAIKKLSEFRYDVLIVDIQIPEVMGEMISENGGVELIKYCDLSTQVYKPLHVVGITSHQDSFDLHSEFFEHHGWPLVLGIENVDLIKNILETKISHSPVNTDVVDIAIVTALHRIELEAVLNLPCDWTEEIYENDNNVYHKGTITKDSGDSLSVVATSCSRMGMASAAATTMKVCSKFKPKTIIMTGIAAGVENKTNFGDILVADPCWDWGSGKSTISDGEAKMLSAPHQQSLDPRIRSIFQGISTNRTYLDEITSNWPVDKRPQNSLSLHVGPVATGAVVLENPETVGNIVSQHRETIGVEMEAYGFSYAASISDCPAPQAIIIKSVCDFANPDKNDDWQQYAAYTSSQMAYKFIVSHL